MAIKDWKRAKSGESVRYPMVWRRKNNGDDTLVVYHYRFWNGRKYELQRNDVTLFQSKFKYEVIKKAREYMKKH